MASAVASTAAASSSTTIVMKPALASASPSPSLLVFYHVPKTGGSSVREWLLRNAGLRSRGLPIRLRGLVRYYEARCFMCLQFGTVFSCPEAERRQCRRAPARKGRGLFDSARDDWRTAGPLAVEFHGPTGWTFIQDVLPRMHAVRELYAARNGSVVLATLLREPVDLLFSSYHMWPPRPDPSPSTRAAKGSSELARVTPFPEWLRSGVGGLQVALFNSPECVTISHAEGHRTRCECARMLRTARAALRSFEVVGITSCLGGFFDRVEAAMLAPPDSRAHRLLRRASRGNVSAGPLHAKPRCFDCSAEEAHAHSVWTWEGLDAVQRAATMRAARCDGAFYQMALTRARRDGVHASDGCALPANRAALTSGPPTSTESDESV